MRKAGVGVGLAFLTLALAPPASSAPATMSHAEQVEMYAAAGFVISADGKNPLNICQQVTRPAVALFDLNGDGKPEAVFIDAGPCYKTDGKSVSIVTKRSDGRWQGMLNREGVLKPGTARTGGWLDVVVIHGGKPETYVHMAEPAPAAAGVGNVVIDSYEPATALAMRANIAKAGDTPAPATPAGAYPTDGWKLPKSVASLTPAEIAALYRAAGFKRVGSAWKGCDGQSDAFLFDDHDQLGFSPIADLNGDGRPEVLVGDSSSECYGDTGQGYTILTPVPGGWKNFWSETGIPEILKTKGAGGWPDIEVGGPGFCHPVERWDGKRYSWIRDVAEMKGGCSNR